MAQLNQVATFELIRPVDHNNKRNLLDGDDGGAILLPVLQMLTSKINHHGTIKPGCHVTIVKWPMAHVRNYNKRVTFTPHLPTPRDQNIYGIKMWVYRAYIGVLLRTSYSCNIIRSSSESHGHKSCQSDQNI